MTDAAAVCAHTADAHTVATLLKLWFRNGAHPGLPGPNEHARGTRTHGSDVCRERRARGTGAGAAPRGRLRVPEGRGGVQCVSSACPVRVYYSSKISTACRPRLPWATLPVRRSAPKAAVVATLRTARHATHPIRARAPRLTCRAPPLGPELPVPIVPANLYKAAVQAAEQARAAARMRARNASRAHARWCAGRCGRLARGACAAAAAQLPRGRVPHTLPRDGPRPPSPRS